MKENNYLRPKIYFLIFIVAYVFGWLAPHHETIMVIEHRDIRKLVFNYAIFGLVIAIGFAITLAYDIYVLYKNKNNHK